MTLDELTEPATADEVEERIYSAFASRGLSTTGWKSGAVVRTLVRGFAIVGAALSSLQALIAKAGFLELSSGDWLTLVAKYVYGVERDLGAFATGNIELDNASGSLYTIGVGDFVVVNPTTLKTYRNTAGFVLNPAETNVLVPVQADEIGTASDATPGQISQIVTALTGVTCTNPSAVLGRDPESDAALQVRCGEKTGTLSPNGPRDAYSFLARSAKTTAGVSAGVTRVRVIADGAGNIAVYIADDDGPLSGSTGDPSTPLGAVNAAIQAYAVPLGITATVQNASALAIAITYEYWLRDNTGQTNAGIIAAVATKLTNFLRAQPIGGHTIAPAAGKVYVTAIEAIIGSAFPTATIKIAVSLPAADVAVAATEVPVAGTFTATAIHQIAGGVT